MNWYLAALVILVMILLTFIFRKGHTFVALDSRKLNPDKQSEKCDLYCKDG